MDEDLERPAQEPDEVVRSTQSWERITFQRGKITFKERLIFWLTAAGGIAIGTVLFLFFLTLFIYVFLPLAFILLLWNLLRKK